MTDTHRYVASCLNLDPSRPETWPVDVVERLTQLKDHCDSQPPNIGITAIGFPVRNPEKDRFLIETATLLGAAY